MALIDKYLSLKKQAQYVLDLETESLAIREREYILSYLKHNPLSYCYIHHRKNIDFFKEEGFIFDREKGTISLP